MGGFNSSPKRPAGDVLCDEGWATHGGLGTPPRAWTRGSSPGASACWGDARAITPSPQYNQLCGHVLSGGGDVRDGRGAAQGAGDAHPLHLLALGVDRLPPGARHQGERRAGREDVRLGERGADFGRARLHKPLPGRKDRGIF